MAHDQRKPAPWTSAGSIVALVSCVPCVIFGFPTSAGELHCDAIRAATGIDRGLALVIASDAAGDLVVAAEAALPARRGRRVPDEQRLTQGVPAPAKVDLDAAWPVFLGDSSRQSRTPASVPAATTDR